MLRQSAVASYNREFGPITKKKCFEYFTNQSEPCSWCNIKNIQAGKTIRREWTDPSKQKTFDVIDTPFRNPDGSLSILEIFRDITKRKQMEEKVRENEEKFRRIFTQAFDATIASGQINIGVFQIILLESFLNLYPQKLQVIHYVISLVV